MDDIHTHQYTSQAVRSTISSMVADGILEEDMKQKLLEHKDKTLKIILDTIWVQNHIENQQPFTKDDLHYIFIAIYKLNNLIEKDTPEHMLKQETNLLLGNNIDLSSPSVLIDIVTKTVTSLSQTPEINADKNLSDAFRQAINNVENASTQETPEEMMIELSKAMKVLLKNQEIKKTPQYRELLKLLHKHTLGCIYASAANEFREHLGKNLTPFLLKGGNKVYAAFGLEIGASLFYIVNANVKFTFSLEVSVKDHHQIEVIKAFSFKAGASGGIESILRSEISGEASAGKGQIFNNRYDFIDFHSNDILPLMVGSVLSTRKKIKGVFKKRKSASIDQQLQQNLDNLKQHLITFDLINCGDKLIAKNKQYVNYIKAKHKQGKIKGSLAGAGNIFSVDASHSALYSRFRRHINLLQALKQSPEMLEKELKQYLFIKTGTKTIMGLLAEEYLQGLNNLHTQIIETEDFIENQKACRDAILKIQQEILEMIQSTFADCERYFKAVNKYDKMKKFSLNRRDRREAANLKHKIEEERGCKGRYAFLRSIITSHVRLCNIYESVSTHNIPSSHMDKEIIAQLRKQEQLYQSPPISLSDQQIKSKLTAHYYCMSKKFKNEKSIKIKIPYTPVVLSCKEYTEEIINHYNSDMNGTYLTLVIQGEGGLKVSDIQAIIGKYPFGSTGRITELDFESSLPTDMSFPLLGVGVKLQFQFVCRDTPLKQKAFLQHIRLYGDATIGGVTPEMPVMVTPAGDVKIKLEASLCKQTVLYEKVGTNTLTYILRCYNGWAANGHASNDIFAMQIAPIKIRGNLGMNYWEKFLHDNEVQLKEVLLNISDRDTNVSHEFKEILELLDDHELNEKIWESLENYNQEPLESNYMKAMYWFGRFMVLNHRLNIAARDRSFSNKP